MNKIINKVSLAGDKCVSEMPLKQPGFTESACRPFTKNKERMQKIIKPPDRRYIYRNEFHNTLFSP